MDKRDWNFPFEEPLHEVFPSLHAAQNAWMSQIDSLHAPDRKTHELIRMVVTVMQRNAEGVRRHAMLAHEVKNPLSGIRGAAQLLEQNACDSDRVLTRLICDEADRIVALVNRMEVFSDRRPIERHAVNIHDVLDHVRRVAQNGFARGIRVIERYDPSLPPVLGNRDQLIQNAITSLSSKVVSQHSDLQAPMAVDAVLRMPAVQVASPTVRKRTVSVKVSSFGRRSTKSAAAMSMPSRTNTWRSWAK